MTKLYHKDKYMPGAIKGGRITNLQPTDHAIKASKSDRYGEFNLPAEVEFGRDDVIEAEVESGRVTKLVIRKPYNNILDRIIVIREIRGCARIITAWLNRNSDKHNTVDLSRYDGN